MANNSTNLVGLDFNTYKTSLKAYLKNNPFFKDIDFEASNINVLIDVLSYNTYHNAFYLNMIGNEMFLDSALLRDSVVSHVKELNYLPRSAISSRMTLDVLVEPPTFVDSLRIPKGHTFTSRIGSDTFTFSTDENITMTAVPFTVDNELRNRFIANSVVIYEGYGVTDTFILDHNNASQRLILSNPGIDTSSVEITVLEDGSVSPLPYVQGSSLFGYDKNSAVFFLQGAENGQYEVLFGNDVVSRRPKNGSVIACSYRVCNGDLPNGSLNIVIDSNIEGQSNIVLTVVRAAELGANAESLDSIKFNAPRYFQTQERAVTSRDYKVLLQAKFPEIQAVHVYGGEEIEPPRYGRVIVAIDVEDADGVPETNVERYRKYLAERTPVSIEPIFVAPDFMYVNISTIVSYNLNATNQTPDDIKSDVQDAVITFCDENINDFDVTLRYSRLIASIDNSDTSIISDDTTLRMVKYFTPLIDDMMQRTPVSIRIYFGNPIDSITTTLFTLFYGNSVLQNVTLSDDGAGNLLIDGIGEAIGTVDYTNGIVDIASVVIMDYQGEGIGFIALPLYKDITVKHNTILSLRPTDINIVATGIYV